MQVTTATQYIGTDGVTFNPISVAGLTESDISYMENIESALRRWARLTTIHPADEDEVYGVLIDALVILEEYGPQALSYATTPATATMTEAGAWAAVGHVVTRVLRLPSHTPVTPRVVRTPAERIVAAGAHLNCAQLALAARKTDEALYWIDAAEAIDPQREDYDRLRHLVGTATPACR